MNFWDSKFNWGQGSVRHCNGTRSSDARNYACSSALRAIAWSLLLLCSLPAHADVLPENRAILAFKREQIALAQQYERSYGGVAQPELEAWIRGARRRTLQIEAARDDAASGSLVASDSPFQLQERAYFAANDDSPQGYWVALPHDYSPTKKWPLVVFLHGYSTSISKLSPWILDIDTLSAATKLGMIVVMPYGRRNSDFVQWGEDDVLRVKRECLKLYSIDESRTFLTGTSMGGYGAYAVGLHTPDEWAAVAPISGRTDFYVWFKTQRDSLPPWKRLLFDADDPRTLIENGRNTPFFTQHGAEDKTVPVEHSRLWAADTARLQLPYEYTETPEVGHENEFQLPALANAIEWLSRHPSRPTSHAISITSGDLREARGDWGQIEAFSDYSELARLDAKVDGNTVRVQTRNVARFTLNLKAFALGTVDLEVNGADSGDFDSAKPIVWSAPEAKTDKSPTLCGPFKSLMRDPFTIIYGNDRDRKDAQKFAKEWSDCADGTIIIKSASTISGTDKRERNIILFGTRDSNSVLREIADKLPLELRTEGFRKGTQFTSGKNLGLRMVWHSPWASGRLIGICSGAWWGDDLPLNHKWDLLPDYIVYHGDQHDKDDTNTAVIAGNFDGSWQ
ncbi:hypothetical protein IAD21_04339 [Abditibacteriota bacterium]|nr:hypothetical protein IAD21_04339 [Abditibacteriota bacterium]